MARMLDISLDAWLFGGLLATFALWLVLSVLVLVDRWRYERRRRALTEITGRLTSVAADSAPSLAEPSGVARILGRLSRRDVYQLVADPTAPRGVTATYAAYSLHRWGLARMIRDASSTQRRAKWRRIAALFALEHIRADGIHALLERAIADADRDVAFAAVVALRRLGDRRAAEILVGALRMQAYPPSRIATELDRFPIPIGDVLRPLLDDPLRHARYWGASLLRRYSGAAGLGPAIAALAGDADGPVRKAALDTLADVDPSLAVPTATSCLRDPVDFVRSTAVRALARIAITDTDPDARRACARVIAPLLTDATFEVRLATKEALVALGLSVWREVAAGLDSPDRFARNGSAEVLQNLGLIDAVIEELSRDVQPSPEIVRVIERVFVEGGPGMVDAAVARSGPQLAPSAAELLTRLGIAA
jgi:hypothetical protein